MIKKGSICFMLFLLIFASVTGAGMAASEDTQEYIIQFQDEIPAEILSALGFETMYTYPSIDSAAVKGNSAQLALLSNQTKLLTVTENKPVNTSLTPQTVSWGYEPVEAPQMAEAGLTGDGVKVAILDTGIDTEHPDLKVAGGVCVAESCPSGFDDNNGHGTHIAGIIAAQDNEIGVLGIAPDVELYAIKSLDQNGDGTTATIIAGIEWAIQNQMDIINLSVTTTANDSALQRILDQAYQQGILLVGSGGNNGTAAGTENNVMYPAKYPTVIAVSSVDSQLKRSSTSATGYEIEIAAPGDQILSTFPSDVLINGSQSNGYAVMSGTSMAAPFVAAMLALYKEKEPAKTSAELRTLLQQNALDLGVAGKDNLYGYGLVQGISEVTEADGNQVAVTSVVNGKVQMEITANELVQTVTVTRNAQPVKSLAEGTFTDYVLAGQYQYAFDFQYADGKKVTIPVKVDVPAPKFSDLSMKQWFAPHMVYLYENSILAGTTSTTMKPDSNITRAMAVAIIGRAVGLNGEKRSTHFSDVGSNNFASGYIQSAYENGILLGFPDGTFRPDQEVTRAEMAMLVAKAYRLDDATPVAFPDVNEKVSGYEAIYKIANANITSGYLDGEFKPYEPMKRSTFAVFIARAENPLFLDVE
ncbi:subtilisin [Bacillus oleivorans]|uniref:Subtilisin n=1 Tax=Bacillus oleivorans TaxID=1448271 RepID=A0A285CK03_9BACI|nr:S8 family serine peptidase [Bacillus oleivorans]SNX67336.1 subtilisin [Bacillus oleivorans]